MIKNCLSAASLVVLTLTMCVSTEAFGGHHLRPARSSRPRGRCSIVERSVHHGPRSKSVRRAHVDPW